MAKSYIRINWKNSPSTSTPVNEPNLNQMDKGIKDCDDAIGDLALLKTTAKADLVAAINEQNENFDVQNSTSNIVLRDGIANSWFGCRIYKCGKTVMLQVSVKKADGTSFSGSNIPILLLPAGYLPIVPLVISGGIGGDYSLNYPVYIYIASTGEMSISISGSNTGNVVHAVITYICK